jgi:Flp pilus assembly pilin Flp
MNAFKYQFGRFGRDEDGAVTVDWVVLTAAVVGLLSLAMAGLRGNMSTVGSRAGDVISGMTINTTLN